MPAEHMSADTVRRCIADYEKERAALARLSDALVAVRRRCSHTYENGASALGRSSRRGRSLVRHCNACDLWVVT